MKSKKFLFFILIIVLAVVYFYDQYNITTPLEEDIMKVAFIDVGQGDCSVIRLPYTNEVIMIDGGEREQFSTISRYLDTNGISTIDYLIATHPHSDHIGSLADIVNYYDVENVYMPKVYHDTKTYENLLLAIKNKGLTVNEVKAGLKLPLSEVDATFVAPNSDTYEELNDYSAVLKLQYKDKTFLFAGDAEEISENEMLSSEFSLYADVLKVGHHGSNTSSKKKFLNEVKPQYAIICADGESYNHPHKSTVKRLENIHSEIFSTYKNGNIIFKTDGKTFDITTER